MPDAAQTAELEAATGELVNAAIAARSYVSTAVTILHDSDQTGLALRATRILEQLDTAIADAQGLL